MSGLTYKKILYFLALAGIFVSLYLTYTKFSNTKVICSFGNCNVVQNSEYSTLLGIPVALLGVIYYFLIFSLIFYKKSKFLFVVTLFGFLYSMYLTYLEIFVIKAICQWCVVSAVIATASFLIVTFNRKNL